MNIRKKAPLAKNDNPRFAKLLTQTLKRIPLKDRNIMKRYWEQCSAIIPNAPHIELVSRDTFPIITLGSPNVASALGFNSRRGACIHFSAEDFSELPDDAAIGLIAHELGHAYLYAINDPSHAADLDDYRWREDEAQERIWSWFFEDEDEALSTWIRNQSNEKEK